MSDTVPSKGERIGLSVACPYCGWAGLNVSRSTCNAGGELNGPNPNDFGCDHFVCITGCAQDQESKVGALAFMLTNSECKPLSGGYLIRLAVGGDVGRPTAAFATEEFCEIIWQQSSDSPPKSAFETAGLVLFALNVSAFFEEAKPLAERARSGTPDDVWRNEAINLMLNRAVGRIVAASAWVEEHGDQEELAEHNAFMAPWVQKINAMRLQLREGEISGEQFDAFIKEFAENVVRF